MINGSACILVATELGPASEPALLWARDHARAVGALLVVCHVVPDAMRSNPLFPQRNEAELLEVSNVLRRAGDLVDEQLERLSMSAEHTKIVVESGRPEEELIRLAEQERAAFIVLGAKRRSGVGHPLGHVVERVVRYAQVPVLVVRGAVRSGVILIATDFSSASEPAHRMGALLVKTANLHATLLHVAETPIHSPAAMSALGRPWLPPPRSALAELRERGIATLQGVADEHRFLRIEHSEGDPATVIVDHAESMGAEMIVVGSRGKTRLRRLVLGSVAEAVVRRSRCSVLVARETAAEREVSVADGRAA
jgi:nucleotide-binding universal stress UspA family protein